MAPCSALLAPGTFEPAWVSSYTLPLAISCAVSGHSIKLESLLSWPLDVLEALGHMLGYPAYMIHDAPT